MWPNGTLLIDRVIGLLGDGNWREVCEIAGELEEVEEKVADVLMFCAEFDFVVFDETHRRVRIDERLMKLLL